MMHVNQVLCPRSDIKLIKPGLKPRSPNSHIQCSFLYNINMIGLYWMMSRLHLKDFVFSALQSGQTGSKGPPAGPPSFRPEDELEHLTKKMLYDMENPPADEYFGE